jgi:2-amino-4-hydroxy-6-hydroxymethyldihydropteridine diphosphokinase
MHYFLSLGSNLGNRRANLGRALAELKKARVKVLRSSSLYRTQPVGYAAQPWFFNQVVEVSTALEPADLLALIKTVEGDLGRRPARRNRPRTIDIDILIAEDRVVATRGLTIPHPRMAERNFVLVPLLEIAPTAVHPLLKENISDLHKRSQDKSAVIKILDRGGRLSSKEARQP